MPAKSDLMPFLIVLLLGISCRIAAQEGQIRIKSYQALGRDDKKIKRNKLLLVPGDSTTDGVANFRTSRSMNQGDLIQFSVRSNKNFVYLLGIDAKNNYREYDQAGTLKSEKELPGASKAFKLDDKGMEHFILIFSARPLDTNFFHFFAGIEMTMDEIFARRVKKQIGGKLIDPSCYTIHNGPDGISITLSEAGNKELENKVLPIVIDTRVSAAIASGTGSATAYSASGPGIILNLQKSADEDFTIAYSINPL